MMQEGPAVAGPGNCAGRAVAQYLAGFYVCYGGINIAESNYTAKSDYAAIRCHNLLPCLANRAPFIPFCIKGGNDFK